MDRRRDSPTLPLSSEFTRTSPALPRSRAAEPDATRQIHRHRMCPGPCFAGHRRCGGGDSLRAPAGRLRYLLLLLLSLPSRRSGVAAARAAAASCPGHTLDMPSAVDDGGGGADGDTAAAARRHRGLVIAHRGASAHLPEHTVGAYRLALELGADFIEPDLVASSDGRLLALHTSDLGVTTDVADVFGAEREPWFSPTANRSGYWAFNFTAAELRRLRVRQRLPAPGRTAMYDGLFGIPFLEDILQLLNEYNAEVLPELFPGGNTSTFAAGGDDDGNDDNAQLRQWRRRVLLARAGVYLELKDSAWLLAETGLDLVRLLLDHIEANPTLWDPLLRCFPDGRLRFDEYLVPGLVVQSFDVDALRRLHKEWPQQRRWGAELPLLQANGTTGENRGATAYAAPPNVLLVSAPDCWSDEFWYQMGSDWRTFVNAVGPDKECMLHPEAGRPFIDRAVEFDLKLHPWTERPEATYLVEGFASVLEETQYLYCQAGAQAVFSESVEAAVAALTAGCDDTDADYSEYQGSATASPTGAPADNADSSQSFPSTSCSADTAATTSSVYVGVTSFAMGVLATLLANCTWRRSSQARQVARGRRVPTFESDLELT